MIKLLKSLIFRERTQVKDSVNDNYTNQEKKICRVDALDQVREDLQRREINIDDLILTGTDDCLLKDVFHSTAIYGFIQWTDLKETYHYDRNNNRKKDHFTYFAHSLLVVGNCPALREMETFTVNLKFSFYGGFAYVLKEPHLNDGITILGTKNLKMLGLYFQQRMEAQQPQYLYTYRSRTEIKS